MFEIFNYYKKQKAIKQFNERKSYFDKQYDHIHIERSITSYEGLFYDIDWVVSDERVGVNGEDYVFPIHGSIRCKSKELLSVLQTIDTTIHTDVVTMSNLTK